METLQFQLKTSLENLEVLENTLQDKRQDLDNYEIDESDFIESYDEMLDDCHGDFMGHCASYTLQQVDPIMYNCGLSEYCGSIDLEDIPEYKEMQEGIESLEIEIEDLQVDIEDLESEIESLESGD